MTAPPVYYNEFDPKAAAWLRELVRQGLLPEGEVDERSIVDVRGHELRGFRQCHFFAGIGGWPYALQLAGWPSTRPVWTGSCPCQPWSTAGNRLGASDDRHLWPEFARIIDECRPATVFGEQAPNVEWMDAACNDLERKDYAVRAEIRRADSIGLFHERRRFYWVAADTTCERQQEQRIDWQDARDRQACFIREAGGLVIAFRRKALPFLCIRHDGISERLGRMCCKGFGNAIVPEVAAEFVVAAMEAMGMREQRARDAERELKEAGQ